MHEFFGVDIMKVYACACMCYS